MHFQFSTAQNFQNDTPNGAIHGHPAGHFSGEWGRCSERGTGGKRERHGYSGIYPETSGKSTWKTTAFGKEFPNHQFPRVGLLVSGRGTCINIDGSRS